MFGFKDINELDKFFHSRIQKEPLKGCIKIEDVEIFSYKSIVKRSTRDLLKRVIEEYDDAAYYKKPKRFFGFGKSY